MFIRKTRTATSNGQQEGIAMPNVHRRTFLKYAGMGTAILSAGAALNSCSKDNTDGSGVSLGSGDTSVLNYAYALEQLEAAFYIQVIATPYAGMSTAEGIILTDIRNHEIAHREFFKAALGANAIASLEVNFTSIDFTSRDKVLATAMAFEDLGVSAYNGAGQYITLPAYLGFAGKIVSVEARHAAVIRDLITAGSFADSTAVDAQGLDKARSPLDVFGIASTYIKTQINVNTLPH
ncbi:Ferritin-like domain-containing protein [Chitinophaga sp. YR573]|uniref:ferritin-like domain-containing protein n=1 Tax=Chitinophaga sp. YR573 TaxID=1881040 RepID=UPI0008C393F7|nr:ferritin-like domain-containing protein [Chitinophaga sp. YR573]SEW10276.1 Ferritin-like domain-containing protein [Chitinophaga sp. YR573]